MARTAIIQPRVAATGRTAVAQARIPRIVLPSEYPTGLIGWVRPGGETVADGTLIQAVTNQKNGARNITQVMSNARPTMRRGASGINGRDAFEFLTDDFLLATAECADWTRNLGAFTGIIAVDLGGTPVIATNTLRCFSDGNNADRWRVDARVAGWTFSGRRAIGETTQVFSDGLGPPSGKHIVHTMADYATTRLRMWVDGALLISSDTMLTAGLTADQASTRVRFGANAASSASSFLNGKTAYEGYWQGAYSDVDRATLVRSWCAYYGIPYLGV